MNLTATLETYIATIEEYETHKVAEGRLASEHLHGWKTNTREHQAQIWDERIQASDLADRAGERLDEITVSLSVRFPEVLPKINELSRRIPTGIGVDFEDHRQVRHDANMRRCMAARQVIGITRSL